MTKADLIERVFKDNRPRKMSRIAVTEMVEAAFDLLAEGIRRDGKFTYPGFGAFNLKKRREREGRNPKTGEKILIKARTTIAFRPAPDLKASIK